MAISTRQSNLFGANDWRSTYQRFNDADFSSYDYETLRKGFVDYLKLTYPETFTDYTESSEHVALLDIIAYMGQALAYRSDLNARENFLETAERRDSIVKLANLVNYNPKRNIAAHGLAKIVGIKTTENVSDINGINLSNLTIIWNDPADSKWQQHFNVILNACLVKSQRIGKPAHSQEIKGIKTDEYSIFTTPNSIPVVPYTAMVDDSPMQFEAVSVTSIDRNYLYETAPTQNQQFNIVYQNDKLGYGSANTGFFVYFKQGSLQYSDFSVTDQQTNFSKDILVAGINNDDTWLFQIDPTSGNRTEWTQTNNLFANSSTRKVFSVASLSDDMVRYTFGDGVFSDRPYGLFRAYYRTSNALEYTINPYEMSGIEIAIPYISKAGRTEQVTLTIELQSTVSNAQGRETISAIKTRAPLQFYSQNRMVNGEDYNNFAYTKFNSILKSKSVNRISVGTSNTLDLLNPTSKYASTVSYADDGSLYVDSYKHILDVKFTNINELIVYITNTFNSVINSIQVAQSYYHNTTPISVPPSEKYKWVLMSHTGTESTGYFVNYQNVGVPVSQYTTSTLKFVTSGAKINFSAPLGSIINSSGYLEKSTIKHTNDNSKLWGTVLSISGDGNNFGSVIQDNTSGPITISGFIPDGMVISALFPEFNTKLTPDIINAITTRMIQQQSFNLEYNHLGDSSQKITFTQYNENANSIATFKCSDVGDYVVNVNMISYMFGSTNSIRFSSDVVKTYTDMQTKLTNKHDVISIRNSTKSYDYRIIGKHVYTDGLSNDYVVEVCSYGSVAVEHPTLYYTITENTNAIPDVNCVFFKETKDINAVVRKEIVPSDVINRSYTSKTEVNRLLSKFKEDQIFYLKSDNSYYIKKLDTASMSYKLVKLTDYSTKYGKPGLSFKYTHVSDSTYRINPNTANIIDMYIATKEYHTNYIAWLSSHNQQIEPLQPSTIELQTAYGELDQYKMISDTVIYNSVKFKPLFGKRADVSLRGVIKVVKSPSTTASDGEIRSRVLSTINEYFYIDNWDFGETFYFSDMSSYVHHSVHGLISSIVVVALDKNKKFGSLYEIQAEPNEIFVSGVTPSDIVVISELSPAELNN